ncbi:MAG: diacylglycerol/lipid kinase family protein [Xanthobacteraceae bacterium]
MKPQRIRVLLNASSGKSAGEDRGRIKNVLESAFQNHTLSATFELLKGEELRAGAERALRRVTDGELDAIVVGGGDGTISTVSSVIAGSDVPLGIIPLGTLNHFAKDLKIPMAIHEAVAIIAAGHLRSVDVGEVNGQIFVNNSSIGLYPYLVLDRERRTSRVGLPKWLALIMASLQVLRYFPLRRLSVHTASGTETYRSPCVFIGNNVYRLSGRSLGTRDRLDEGQLSLYVAKQQSRLALLWLALRSVIGFLDHKTDLRVFNLPAVEISSYHRRLLVALDGEIDIIRSPLHYRIRSAALRVFAPSPTGI